MPDREKVIQGLEFTKAMITFNPSTGEDIEPGNLNEADKTTYDACVGALALLKEQETIIQCIKGKCRICPHCANCDVDENGLIKEQEAVNPKWKDARYELPDQEGDYLVFIPGEYHDTMMVVRYSFNCKIPWRGAQAHSAIEDVLLWMPLPKVPKEGR